MRKLLTNKLKKSPLVHRVGAKLLKFLGLSRGAREKTEVLRSAEAMVESPIPLDVSQRFGYQIFHDPDNPLIARGHSFEPEVHSCLCYLIFLDRLRGNTPRVADIGANIGLHTLELKRKFHDLEIVAFDPSPLSWRYLELTLEYNQVEGVELHKYALGDEEGDIDFYAWGGSSSGDSLRNTLRQEDVPYKIISVPITTLDKAIGSDSITIIKMDCEGAEVDILKGMKELIKRVRPLIVTELFLENQVVFGIESSDVYETVEGVGYSIFTISFQKLSKAGFVSLHKNGEENYVLLPNEMEEPFTD